MEKHINSSASSADDLGKPIAKKSNHIAINDSWLYASEPLLVNPEILLAIEDTKIVPIITLEENDSHITVSISLENQIYLLNYNPHKSTYAVDLFSYAKND